MHEAADVDAFPPPDRVEQYAPLDERRLPSAERRPIDVDERRHRAVPYVTSGRVFQIQSRQRPLLRVVVDEAGQRARLGVDRRVDGAENEHNDPVEPYAPGERAEQERAAAQPEDEEEAYVAHTNPGGAAGS